MFIFEALLRVYDFFRALLLEGTLGDGNIEANVYNFFLVVLRLVGLTL